MFLCLCHALVYTLSMSCLGLYFVSSSLTCHVYFMFCSIFLNVFVFRLNFIFSFILHPSCIIFYPCSYLLFFPSFLLFHMSLCDKDGESIPKSISVCFVISIWLMCTFLGREVLPRAHLYGKKAIGEKHTPRGRRHLLWENLVLFCFTLYLFSCCFTVL